MSLLGPISTLGRWKSEAFNADFLAGVAPAGYTHTRASTATYWDAAGTLRTAAAHEPRFNFDPLTKAILGLLMEGAATNKLTYSEFQLPALVVAPAQAVAVNWGRGMPKTGVRLKLDAATTCNAYRTSARVTGETECFSAFVRMDNGDRPVIGLSGAAAVDMAIVMSGSALPVERTGIIDCGDGLYRVYGWHTYTSDNAASSCGIVKYSSNSARGFVVTGYQIEKGIYPSSYIATAADGVTRAVDGGTFDVAWYNAAAGGALLVEGSHKSQAAEAKTIGVVVLSNGSSSNRAGLYLVPSDARIQSVLAVDGVTSMNLSSYGQSALFDGNRFRLGLEFGSWGGVARSNGLPIGTGSSGSSALPNGVDRLQIFTGGLGVTHYRLLRYYASRADITTLTAR